MSALVIVATLIAVAAAFTVSASAGLGGSLILVPSLALILGTKEGVALAALLLAGNNVVKVVAYRDSLPFRSALTVISLLWVGAALGASLLVAAAERTVTVAVIGAFAFALVAERWELAGLRRLGAPALSFAAGATSGFTGTSGPLKGVAIRSLDLDRRHFVGAASLASLVGDVTKAAIFAEAQLFGTTELLVLAASIPLMFVATFGGRWINREIGERGYAALFWTVMAGYTARLVFAL